jgi:outer membrane biogenesis lipoprotein LolB
MGDVKKNLFVVALALLSGCAVVTYNRYNVSTSTENGVAWQSLEGHDGDK